MRVRCPICLDVFKNDAEMQKHLPCDWSEFHGSTAVALSEVEVTLRVEKAVREEREAVVRYLLAYDAHGHCGGIAGDDAAAGITRGDHRK